MYWWLIASGFIPLTKMWQLKCLFGNFIPLLEETQILRWNEIFHLSMKYISTLIFVTLIMFYDVMWIIVKISVLLQYEMRVKRISMTSSFLIIRPHLKYGRISREKAIDNFKDSTYGPCVPGKHGSPQDMIRYFVWVKKYWQTEKK